MLTQLSSIHRAAEPQDLVDLLGECHQRIRYFVSLARQAGSQQGVPSDQIVRACLDVERYFTQALPLHVADEEESIEPRLRGLSPTVDVALDAAASQHRQHAPRVNALLRAMSLLCNRPSDETTRREAATTALALETQFEEHLRLEESVIFPAIRELLSRETRTLIADELRNRRQRGLLRPGPTPPTNREDEP